MNTDFKILFDGQQHQIDADVLISNLIKRIPRGLPRGQTKETNGF
jgi:hypothetical protein